MLNKIKKSNSEGFTIIEVMIVLAVAALILLIVLLAVPALQRNSRNTALKNDVSTISGGISTYTSDNDGVEPTSVTLSSAGTVSIGTSGGSSNETVSVQGSTKVAAYGATNTANNTVYVAIGDKCSGNTPVAGTSTDIALYYNEETSGSNIPQCITAQ
jgi:prepilin-type N-terminal cleavage/methylation domain-containing protein